MIDDSDYYAILGVPQDATEAVIRDTFAGLLSRFPQDVREQDNPAYAQILHAYNVLNDPERRATYDSLLTDTAVSALTVNIQASKDELSPSEAIQLIYLLIEILPPAANSKSHQPLNLSLVIDRSTSMNGDRLNHVKSALEILIEKLAPDDAISIISFSDRAEIVVPSQPANNKKALLAKIRGIFTSGGTEIYQGLSASVQQLRQVSISKHINHLILLTDGHTYGDADQCWQLAQQSARQNIGFSAFGIGAEWNDQFLDKLVAPSGGQSQYIEAPSQIIDYLQERIKGLNNVYARNLRLSLDFPASVTSQFGFKLSPFAQPLTLNQQEAKLGNLESRLPLSFLLEMRVKPQMRETRINIPLNFLADLPRQQNYAFKRQHRLTIVKEVIQSPPPPDLIKAVRLLSMYRVSEKVQDDVDAGHLEAATTRMRHLTTRLLEVGQTKLAQQAHAEGERLATMGALSEEGRKKLKYGTRALLKQTIASLDMELE